MLSEQNHISPLVILDELDKAEVSYRGDPLNPLHNLLEPVSAREFRDESISMPIDASHVIWIATANYLGKIPLRARPFVTVPVVAAGAAPSGFYPKERV